MKVCHICTQQYGLLSYTLHNCALAVFGPESELANNVLCSILCVLFLYWPSHSLLTRLENFTCYVPLSAVSILRSSYFISTLCYCSSAGLLETLFSCYYDCSTVEDEVFYKWESEVKSKSDGKLHGVALMGTKHFFEFIRNPEGHDV